ncbi:MAG: hypothetical protein O3C40_37245 [Planctomycetota bacterium]|nr:hypothetical protein [Planctomycetota bacterium]
MEAVMWIAVAGGVAWIVSTAAMVFELWADEDLPLEKSEPVSPGLCCDLYLSPVQRRVIGRWIDDQSVPCGTLAAFARQMHRAKQHHSIPVYWGQVQPLLELLEARNLISVSRQLKNSRTGDGHRL